MVMLGMITIICLLHLYIIERHYKAHVRNEALLMDMIVNLQNEMNRMDAEIQELIEDTKWN